MRKNGMTNRRLLTLGLAALGCLSCGQAIGDGPAGPMSGIDPRVDRVLHGMSDFLRSVAEYSFRAEVEYDSVLNTGQKIQYGGTSNVFVRRPDRVRAEYRGDERSTTSVFDGTTITILDRERELYAQADIPGTIDEAVDRVFEYYGFSVPIADFVYADPYQVLTEYVETGEWIGLHTIDGAPCHHLAFTQQTIDWQIWIEDGPQPVPRKLVITYKDEPAAPQYTARLTWNLQPRFSESWFVFEPPIGADRIEFLPIDPGVPDDTEVEE